MNRNKPFVFIFCLALFAASFAVLSCVRDESHSPTKCQARSRQRLACGKRSVITPLFVSPPEARLAPPKTSCLVSAPTWRECLEHFGYALFEVLFIVCWLA